MNANTEKTETKPTKMGPLKWLFSSWDTVTKGGASARKLSAFYAIVFIAGPCSIAKTNEENVFWIVIVWLVFAAICLGMVTVSELISLKNGYANKDKPEGKNDNAE